MGLQQSTLTRPPRQGGPGDDKVTDPGDDRVTVVNIDDTGGKQHDSQDKKIQGLTRLLTVNKTRSDDIYKDDVDHYEGNMMILKQIFKKMDPDLMNNSSHGSQGELQLSFKHDASREVLLVKVIRARELNARNLRGKAANAYVMMSMLPSSSDRMSHKTKTVKKTLSPVFHEIFAFQVQEFELETGSLVIQVWDEDFMDRDELIGEVIIELNTLQLLQSAVYTDWYHLQAKVDHEIGGSVDVSLAEDETSQSLTVTIHSANDLTNRYTHGAPNPFVKLQIPGLKQLVKTKISYNTVNPQWQQTFHFPISACQLRDRQLVLHVIDHDNSDRNESLGQVIINLNDLHLGDSHHARFPLAELRKPGHQTLGSVPSTSLVEFRESLVAHACAKYPKFLFQKQTGSKVIRVRNTKLCTETKLRIIDGVPIF